MKGSTFGDDIYDEGGDVTVKKLVDRVIQITGKEAALFVPSGTMGNQICLRTHLHQPPHTILLDYRAHVQCWETGAIPLLSQATVTGIEPKNGVHLTLDDLKDRIVEENNCMFTFQACARYYLYVSDHILYQFISLPPGSFPSKTP